MYRLITSKIAICHYLLFCYKWKGKSTFFFTPYFNRIAQRRSLFERFHFIICFHWIHIENRWPALQRIKVNELCVCVCAECMTTIVKSGFSNFDWTRMMCIVYTMYMQFPSNAPRHQFHFTQIDSIANSSRIENDGEKAAIEKWCTQRNQLIKSSCASLFLLEGILNAKHYMNAHTYSHERTHVRCRDCFASCSWWTSNFISSFTHIHTSLTSFIYLFFCLH